ncbi:6-hydroxymethylpterin diphosphokinase MptE-like protein [Methylomonas sp. AM2-LC]|uniref:6-hydroxymethylpterin diphosphokinase MptE-like protein n=1 Tax=Methylomonas sp. AM2-LC TaxID=3153301 RepID=UPI0032676036
MENTRLAEENNFGPLSVNRFGESYFFNINRDSFVKTSAEALFEKKFAKTLFNENALYIVVGTDSGLLPHYIQKNQLPKGSRYIFIEPVSVLAALTANGLLADLDAERIACISLDEWVITIQNFKIRDYFYINAVQSYNAFCAEDDHIQEYAELSWHITEVLSQLHWTNTIELGSEAFISRQLKNVADTLLPAKLLEQAFAKKTVVLLAGGPSLDDAISWVRLNRQRLVIFAVSRISRQLIQAEIAPDFVFSVDPTELSFDVSKEMLNFPNQTTFIFSHHTVSSLVNQWPGRALYLGARFPWKTDLNLANISSVGPTVTNTAINVAHCFGFKRIILAGLDLCFTRDGFTHAKGSDEQLAGPRFNLTSLQVETNDGFMAPTSLDFSQAIANLAVQAKQLSGNGCQLINVSGQAAKIESIEYLPIDALDLEESGVDVAAIVAAKVDALPADTLFYQKTLQELKRARFQINAIAHLSEKARKVNDEMYNAQGIIENYKDKKQLDQIEKKFKREHRHFSRLVKIYGIRRFIKVAKPFVDEEWTAEEAKQMGNVFYDAYLEGTTNLLNLLDDAISRVEARQQESLEHADFNLLIAQCRKDKSYGRVRLWLKKYAHTQIPEAIAVTLAEFEQNFVAILQDKNTQHFANAQNHSSLFILKKRAGLLFKHKKIEDLQALLTGLEKHKQQAEQGVPYRHLINGYLAELKGEPANALNAYQQIVAAADVLLEEALIRIAAISIEQNDSESIQISLQCLSQLNPVYLPMYAEIQRLRGNIMQAIDAYSTYINQFPGDSVTQLKFVMLYVEQNIFDAAEIMLDYILLNKPNLEAALLLKKQILSLKADTKNFVC